MEGLVITYLKDINCSNFTGYGTSYGTGARIMYRDGCGSHNGFGYGCGEDKGSGSTSELNDYRGDGSGADFCDGAGDIYYQGHGFGSNIESFSPVK